MMRRPLTSKSSDAPPVSGRSPIVRVVVLVLVLEGLTTLGLRVAVGAPETERDAAPGVVAVDEGRDGVSLPGDRQEEPPRTASFDPELD